MNLFKFPSKEETQAENPVLLFRDLKRDPSIKFLWGHQEKVLDSYYATHVNKKDLAIELPTGTGKTLVGLLIAEWRRRSKQERVVFLCSTRQLCSQVQSQSKKYGIRTSLLTGPQAHYDEQAFYSYQQGKAVGISTYSGLFNTNPRISDPQVIICDDAHAAEGFIADMWTLRVEREWHVKLYDQLYTILRGVMTDVMANRLENPDEKGDRVVELISPIALNSQRAALADAVTAFLDEYTVLKHPWQMIAKHLPVCNVFVSHYVIEIRPVLPPTLTHPPFAGATQRIYMSATLGEDGDLERSFGVKSIARLPIPEGWDNRGTGRRLILFPELSPKVGADLLPQLLPQVKRTLILVPNSDTRDEFKKELEGTVSVLDGSDIEAQVEKFRTHAGPVVLVLANRYDGIDFPGDDCRSLLLCELPRGAGLQELFFTERLKAFLITKDRVRTRVTQAVGRCTRDETDFSIVLVFGDRLVKWFCTRENVVGMHPELQAEIEFGMTNSTDPTTETFLKLCRAFLEQNEEWSKADSWIRGERAKMKKQADIGVSALQKAAEHEIDFVYAMWNGNYEDAYKMADKVLGVLSGGEEMRSYRCFWQYEAACAAFLLWNQTSDDAFRGLAIERLQEAAKGNFGIDWFAGLAAQLKAPPVPTETTDVSEWFSVIEDVLTDLGAKGPKYDRAIAEQRAFITSREPKKFHQGLAFLGRLLGATVHQWEGDAKPDGFWNLAYQRGFVFEAKTQELVEGSVSVTTVRQSLT
ncbi:MAG: DEAD/DEAH box helicase family protein, partial [Limisphaerales bacterium]